MTTDSEQPLRPIRRSIAVSWSPEEAFRRFTADFEAWWPKQALSIGGPRVKQVVFECRPGGLIYEEHQDGTRFLWGRITALDPPHRVAFTWSASQEEADAQQVEVSFTKEQTGTRVELVSSGWERMGAKARGTYGGYRLTWRVALERFAERFSAGLLFFNAMSAGFELFRLRDKFIAGSRGRMPAGPAEEKRCEKPDWVAPITLQLAPVGCAPAPAGLTSSQAMAIQDSDRAALAQLSRYSAAAQWDSVVGLYSTDSTFRWVDRGQVTAANPSVESFPAVKWDRTRAREETRAPIRRATPAVSLSLPMPRGLAMLPTIVLIIVALIAALLIYAASRPASFRIERSTAINAPPDAIFPFINDFHRWSAWSPWEKLDKGLQRTFSGAASGKGAVYEWQGNNKVGQGRMEITDAVPASRITIKLDFLKPLEAHNTAEFTLVPQGGATRLSWAMFGASPYMARLMGVVFNMDKMLGKSFDIGLANLKALAESP